ncbi:transposon Tf2-9 polyprotein [Trichonephila clavipes]|nr:transposon Tf2-9 polyprotein [Trichonephila clavipes]
MCEQTLALGVSKPITDTGTKFNYIVSHLPPEAAAIVRQTDDMDETDPYSTIKAQLIQQEIRKLLTGEELGDRKPSELFRTMNWHAASHNIPKELISSNIAFLIDTGSDVSVLAASISERRKGNGIQQLSAANTSPISVYVHSIKLVSGESIFHDVLREFPETVKPPSFSQEVKHNIKHFIETSGSPVFAKAKRLAPDHLKIDKSEFQQTLNLGHIRPSKSNYASPLHFVPKKVSNDWRPVGIRNKKRPKRNVKIKPEEVLEWTDKATTTFELVKQALAHATLLHHPMPNALLSIWVDAPDFAVGGALAQYHENNIAAAQLVDEELKQLLESNSTSKQQYFPLKDITLTCDVSTNVSQPFIPKDYHRIVFQHLQGLSHPGITASTKIVTQHFVWPNIRRYIKACVSMGILSSYHPCQRSKIHRHTKAPIGTFALPDARFSQIHIDFIGSFPPSNGESYCLTTVDRFTRWMEVITTADMTEETVCRALLSVWISCFGCPCYYNNRPRYNLQIKPFQRVEQSSWHKQNTMLCLSSESE